MEKLKDKVAVITGGSSGMGLATAQRFVAEGAYVYIMGRRGAELDAAVKAIGRNVTAVQGDIAQPADLERLYETVRAGQGHLDVVFANAGIGELAPLATLSAEHFDRIFNINVRGTLFTVQKALPLLRDGDSIILTGSIAGVKGIPGFTVYSASKAALRSFVRTWTAELQDRRIRANIISPGTIDTPILAGLPKEAIAQLVAGIPMGRMGQSREIADAALFLASGDASFISGIELFVDGGSVQV